jgi:replicative DNA helicase|tara:strand:+ start:489 stop:1448 length:960 start_codon:yes stop_codon:yes gene_type:complete
MTEESQDSSSLFQERGFQRIDKAVNQSLSIVRNAMHGKRSVYPTKWPRLNKNLLGGLQGGKMYVIAGRPGVGKSAFSNQLVFDLLDVNSNKDMIVLYWSFEMPGYQQVMRSASKSVNKQLGDLLSVEARLKDEEFKDYANSVQKFNKYPVFFNNIPRTMEYIKQTNEQVFMKSPNARVVNVFDHSRLIKGHNEHTELQKLNEISKGCMWMQAKMDVINILLSQLNRNIEQEHRAKNQYQPLLTDLFGGDSIGQDAHVVMILNRPYDIYGITKTYCNEDPVGLLACHIEKNRDGLLGMIPYEADMSTFTIQERTKNDTKS